MKLLKIAYSIAFCMFIGEVQLQVLDTPGIQNYFLLYAYNHIPTGMAKENYT